MPFTRIAVRAGKPAAYKKALVSGIQRALIETFSVPEDDFFMVINEYDADSFVFGRNYLGIARSDDLVIIQVTANSTRGVAEKKKLYAAIAANLAESPGVRGEDVFVNVVEVSRENWSFGLGAAQYA
ncbi:tautomerase family protein [Trinickia terrae]|uniref:Tautomerase family protein n=1 Tax=Trinickia terrae TaxID=2571161 RepID=A0A4U1IG74_9BURK|nr:tautomerase family protein [Trinickia terrae]TKC92687.1 tautomerase family protein [Trinickia terrae]